MCCPARRWLRAFTLKETIYTIVEAILLLLLILFIVYLVLHLSACPLTQRNNKKQCGGNRSNGTKLEAPNVVNSSRAEPRRFNAGNNNNVTFIYKVTNETSARAGEDVNDLSPNTTTQGGISVNYTIVTSTVTKGTAAAINEGNNTDTTELQPRSMNVVVTTAKIADAATVISIESKEPESRELRQNQSSSEEEMFYVEYSEDEPGSDNTIVPIVKHCKKCEEAQRDHESGKCDCGACASNRSVTLEPRGGAPNSVGVSPQAGALPVDTPSLGGAPPPAGTSPGPGAVRRLTIVESKLTDDDAASELHKALVVALVRAEPDDTFTYSCVTVVVSEFWSLGAAACIRDLRADTLGLYFLVERFGEAAVGESHAVVEAARGGGGGGGGGGAGGALALRAGRSLLAGGGRPARLADPLDHLLLVLGDTFTALGFGKFRSIQPRNEDLRLRQTCINWVLEEACGGGGGGGGGSFPLCGGVLFGAAAPCYYCVGTPLFRGDVLYGLAGGEGGCGAACPPRRYVPAAALRAWLHDLMAADRGEDYPNDYY